MFIENVERDYPKLRKSDIWHISLLWSSQINCLSVSINVLLLRSSEAKLRLQNSPAEASSGTLPEIPSGLDSESINFIEDFFVDWDDWGLRAAGSSDAIEPGESCVAASPSHRSIREKQRIDPVS